MNEILVTCPTCKKRFSYYSSEFRPFCTDKCRLIDLGQWLEESYKVPVEKLTDEEALTLEQLIHEKSFEEKNDSED